MIKRDKIGKSTQQGFTLVEVAIVMVIIGLLIGGVLKGQEMIQNAKVKRFVQQGDDLRASVMAFYDKYGMYPGDENNTSAPVNDNGLSGDNDGHMENNVERYELFNDLQRANLISGTYNGTNELPQHVFGGDVSVQWVPAYGTTTHYIYYENVPRNVCIEIDAKYDDGNYRTGQIRCRRPYTSGRATYEWFAVTF